MEWHVAVEEITPHVVQITTPQGSGTGFFIFRSADAAACAVATAAHVIDHANFWEQPIRIRNTDTGDVLLLRAADRAIFVDEAKDTAIILFRPQSFPLPNQPFGMIEKDYMQKVGTQIGWLGFPAIPAADLCFFQGTISAWLGTHNAYFVDGVAINGVSGGPAFTCYGDSPEIIGVMSAYMPNRATGETLPGLAIVRDVIHLRDVVEKFKSFEDAKAKEVAPAEPPPPPPVAPLGATNLRSAT